MKIYIYIVMFLTLMFSIENYKLIKVYNPTTEVMHQLNSLGAEIDHATYKKGEYIEFAASSRFVDKISYLDIEFEVVHEDLQSFYESRLYNIQSRDFDYGSMGGYYTHEEINEHLQEISEDYPTLASSLQVIGQSLEGRDIYAIKLSDNPNVDENEPEVLYTGLHHAREPMSYMNLFYYMYWLLENYDTDDLASGILDNRELWFVPCLNPDGLVYNQEYAPNGGGMQRKNHRETCSNNNNQNNWDGIDLNRNYGFMWGYDDQGSSPDPCNQTYRGPSSFSEPETQAIRDFVLEHDFLAAFNYHSYGNLLIHPYGYIPGLLPPEPDLSTFREYGNEMTKYNNYLMGTGIETVGYTVNGEADDWFYGEENIFAYTPEVGNSNDGFWPASDRILPLAEENLYPNQFLSLIVGAHYEIELDGVNNDSFVSGQDYYLSLYINNKGLSTSNGDVYVDVSSTSDDIVFEESNFIISGINGRTEVELDDLIQFQISNNSSDGIEQITVFISDDDGIVTSDSIEIVVGEPIVYISENFNNNSGWYVGSNSDDASSGIWERGIPNATYYEGVIVQPGYDSQNDEGSYCFITGNDIQGDNVGYDDVDGGKTTLFSPIFDLSDFEESFVSYEKWYSNNVGDNPSNDSFELQISNDGGANWINVVSTNITNNSWEWSYHSITDYISLNDEVQFRFIASDEYFDGDNGTGGSIIEAAIDNFNIVVFESQSCNDAGDSNGDGVVNVLDVVLIINHILDVEELSELCSADLNGDEVINVLDIVLVVNLILG